MKDIDFFEIFAGLTMLIVFSALFILIAMDMKINSESQDEYINQLEQNAYEQIEEKEVYVNKCKIYEDLLKSNGLLDECECR